MIMDDDEEDELQIEAEIRGQQIPCSDDEDHQSINTGEGQPRQRAASPDGVRVNDEEEDYDMGQRQNGYDAINDDEEQREGSQEENGNDRLRASLDKMPGWRPMIMGSGVKSLPAAFETALPGHWIQWNDIGQPFRPGAEPLPARTLCMCSDKENFEHDAQRLSDFATHSDPVKRARSVATAALWGMFTTGTSKGWMCSPNHTELNTPRFKEAEGEELDKQRKKLQGNIKAYTYHPNAKSPDLMLRDDTAMQFGWCFEELYDSSGLEVLAYRIFKQIYDHGHSDDELWRHLMEENAEITRAGTINGIPESLRSAKMMIQNKLQRTQINDEDMQNTASTQYKRLTNMTDLIKMYKAHSGKCDGSGGRPLYSDIRSDTPIGCQARPFVAEKNDGGKHPLGPSVAFNFKRYLAPDVIASGHPGVNVSIAGCVDDEGNPLDIHPDQADPNNYYDIEGRFRPPEWVRKKGCFFVCHDVNVRNIFNLPFPRPVHGSVVPDDCLLEIFWDLNKDTIPRLVEAIEKGGRKDPPRDQFVHHKDLVGTLFHNMSKERDEMAAKISEGVLDTEMLSADSIDKSAAEQERLNNMRCYGRKVATKEGDRFVLEPQQVLLDLSEEQERIHGMIDEWDIKQRTGIHSDSVASQRNRTYFDRAGADTTRADRHSCAVDSCVKLGLRRFENSFASKKLSSSIPPGWKDVAHKGLCDAVKATADFGLKRAAANQGRRVDPKDPNSKNGTANVAFAHGRSAQARDFSAFGHWRSFLMHLFSSGVKVSGPDVRVMLECWLHAFEPFQEVSFFFLMCGGPGAGKSMRAKRLQALLANGWIKGSGSSSAKAGMNGGMDHLCGRLVYYDEITNDFGSNDSERIEYLKSITMEQHVNNTRTVKTMGSNGLESFTTVVLHSLHYESHLMSTNCGPLGLKADVEPSTNRAALSDRSWAHITHAADDNGDTADVDFDQMKASPEVKAMINQLRVCSCLIAYVLIYIKEIPHCRPNLAFASLLTNKWDSILWNEYNLPRPSKRKRIKRRMMFELFAVESAVAEKFFLEETAVAYEDMRPNADGTLSAYCVDQLVDVVRALQRCLDHETILNSWSHSLDHSPPTSAHVFQMKTVLSQLHGSSLDHCILSGPASVSAPTSTHGQSNETNHYPSDDVINAMADHMAGNNASFDDQFPRDADGPQPPPDMCGTGENDELRAPKSLNGKDVLNTIQARRMMQNGMTRADCGRLAEHLELQRQIRSEYSRRLEKRGRRDGGRNYVGALEQITDVFVDGVDSHNIPMHKMASTGKVVEATKAAAAVMPTAQDVLCSGIDEEFLTSILGGTDSNKFGLDLQMLGIYPKGWEYECTSSKSGARGPADYDFNWAMLSAFTKTKTSDEGGGGSGGGDRARKRSIWTNVARQVKDSVRSGNNSRKDKPFSLMDIESMTFESMRDTLFLIAQPLSENKVRIAKHCYMQTQTMRRQSRMHAKGLPFGEETVETSVHPQHMYSTDSRQGLKHDPSFLNPVGIERLGGAETSQLQKRLDHYCEHRALASCVAPVAFEKDLPIKESEAHNAIYFSKWIANEHAALVVESSAFLARVPGVAGGDCTKVPATFRRGENATTSNEGKPKTLKVITETSRHGTMRDDEGMSRMDPDPTTVRQDPMQPERATEEAQRDYEREQAEMEEEYEGSAYPPRASNEIDDNAEGMEPLEMDISDPGSAGSGLNAEPGVAARSARMSVDEGAEVKAMPYDWDLLQMFLTFKMADTLHNDCHDHVGRFAEFFPDVFENEDTEDTLRDLPQICMRFPGLKDKTTSSNYLFPLSRSVPLSASRVSDLDSTVNARHAPRELAEAALSMAMGRKIRYNDPEVMDHEAESRGVDGSAMLHGNLFSRSSWLNFTLRAMDARGMGTEDEIERTQDQGLNLLMRVRNARAASGHIERQKSLRSNEKLDLHSFAAQERSMRERGIDAAVSGRDPDQAPPPTEEQSKQAHKRIAENNTYYERFDASAKKCPRNV